MFIQILIYLVVSILTKHDENMVVMSNFKQF
jgi:hypothetical protein